MAWPSVYTYNFCSNPSFEVDLTGVTAVNGGLPTLNTGTGLYGTQSLQVTTPGQSTSEGVILPPGTILASATGCVSFFLQGADVTESGTLNVYAIDTTSATTLGSTTVSFDNTTGWTQVSIGSLALVNAHSIAVYIETIGIQQTSFLVDAIQYEPSLTLNAGVLPTPYIDGDQLFGTWVGTQQESASFKLYQFQLSGSGDIRTSGSGALLQQGEVFLLVNTDPASGPTQITGQIDLSGMSFIGLDSAVLAGGGTVVPTGITVLLMFAGLTDFSVFSPGDVDPAIALIGYNNAGIGTGVNTTGSAGYNRAFATFSAPQAFTDSAGVNVWNTAAYFAVGYEFASIPASGAQNITHVQAELVPGTGTAVVPSPYVRPRALTAILAPTTMNYVTNPSFETNTTGWTAIPSTTISRSTAHAFVGSASLAHTGTATHVGSYMVVPDLIVGEEYTISAYATHTDGANLRYVTVAANPTASFGASASATAAIVSTAWTQVDLQFIATACNMTFAFWCANALTSPTSTTMDWNLDAVMVSPGGLVAYGDGSFSGWNWESTVNDSRSYYYERGNVAYVAVQSVLSDHLALGLHAYAPVYNTPVTQYS